MSTEKLTADLLQSLRETRTVFGPAAAATKLELLARCATCRLADARMVRDYHDLLLFLAAYPDGKRLHGLVEAELRRAAEAGAALAGTRRGAEVLHGTGIAGSDLVSSFTLDLTEWLVERFPDDVEVAWEDESAGDALDELLPLCATRVESDGLLDTDLSTARWVQLARGATGGSDLRWLLSRFRSLGCPPELLDRVFESVELRVRMQLRQPSSSLTFARFPPRPICFQRTPLERQVDPEATVARTLPPPRRLTAGDGRDLLETARISLVARSRETDPITYANPREITLFSLDRGVDVALFGMLPERRLPVESFFGYMAARNRVPIAYGGAWVFFDRAEIGINIFDAFRGGESALLFSEIMRVYRQHFGVRRFLVDPFQFGAGNADGIRSGAFWFYYRLGFRPADPGLVALAETQWQSLRADRRYRSPAKVLRRLAGAKLEWTPVEPAGNAPDLIRLSLGVTGMIGERFAGSRHDAERRCRQQVARWLGVRNLSAWPDPQRRWFERLSPLMSMMPEIRDWPACDRRALATALKAKGGPRERDYAVRLQSHQRLRDSLTLIAAKTRRNPDC